MLPAVESLCRAVAAEDAAAAAAAALAAAPESSHTPPGSRRVLILKHSLRDEYDEATDVSRLFRLKAAPGFAAFVGGALVEAWTGGSSARLRACVDRYSRGRGGDAAL